MLVKSKNINSYFKAPNFKLLNINKKVINLNEIKGSKGTLICFICNHCPYVKAIIHKLVRDTNELRKYDISSVAIMPNDVNSYPEDSFDKMVEFSKINKLEIPYLYDETQNVAKSYNAVCTPDFFGFNSNLELKFRGRIDNSGINNIENTKRELFYSMLAISNNKKIPFNNPSIGCSIKWKKDD